ncbi:hypothetical protein EL22_08185 [Halostagnicola sp. A56]|uniref:DUF7139 domain-containing protein n=1 Tax=Halostagnicola sp. A56 TaxID=1495067 RepID=UPI0004A0BC9B|nr:hypothetical protein [Halostagnicola sp. A56]KDE57977.1 hypothetical protein EL22_08185 [Halostagnicola sp. A56]
MTSLTEVYRGNEREVSSLRRLYTGAVLVAIGAILAVVAVFVATTELFSSYFPHPLGPIRGAGVMAGIGVPTAFVGVFIVLPASRRVKAAAAIGTSLCMLGVAMFSYAYPEHWRFHGKELTLHVSVVYLLGLFITVCCLFIAVVNFKTRNDPGGMLEMNVTRRGETKVVEVDNSSGGALGGVGLFGADPDGDVETQTNVDGDSKMRSTGGSGTNGAPAGSGAVPTSDGGSQPESLESPLETGDGRDAELVDAPVQPESPVEPADRYCGNCHHFEYVRTDSGMVPYCGYHDGGMKDMDPCEEWTPNRHDSDSQ